MTINEVTLNRPILSRLQRLLIPSVENLPVRLEVAHSDLQYEIFCVDSSRINFRCVHLSPVLPCCLGDVRPSVSFGLIFVLCHLCCW